ncbi:MAG: isoleucine--tRNA ligase [Alphaproteobacteria bacterium]|nr:isoleucine--tRNA ligase [Alphaproteobacteria bacterium]
MSETPPNNDQFRDTVFLPKTEFPMRGELPKNEPSMVAGWRDMDLYARIREQSAGRKKWILHDGPPYANGHIHMGHALNKILKDVINKSWQMMGPSADAPNGYDAPYVPGWDCHGLPIEWKIEEQYREKGIDKDSVPPLQFRQECREFAQKWVDIQAEEFQRLGVIGDWKNPYLTMTKPAEAQIAREIHKFLVNGGLYRGVKPVMWSTVEKTALAEAEVEYHEHKSVTVWVKFPIVKTDNKKLEGGNIVIWTTTPWTLPSNRAIAYGFEIEYSVYKVTSIAEGSKAKIGEKLVLSEKLADSFKKQIKILEWEKIESFNKFDTGVITEERQNPFKGTVCAHPLRGKGYDFDVPVLYGNFVTDDTGTGFVHIAPGHGEDDYYLYFQHFGADSIPDNVTDDGKFRDHVPLFAGQEIYTAKGELGDGNFAVIKAMDEAGALLAKGSLRHEYPHSWRSKAPVIFRTTPQWFIGMENGITLRQKALAAIKETKWHPAKGETRITAMIEGRPDWCISRQRAWGVPIALFVNKKTQEPLKDPAVLKRITDSFETEGSDAWWSKDAQYFLGDKYKSDDYEQIFDIVDVWFESGSTHSFVVDARDELKGGQADLYLEGSDQHRGWFHSSLLESCGTKGHAPFKNVLTHGFVLDDKGYKMSKSLGNVVDPLEVMKEHGADILRLWTMTSDYAEDIRIGKDTLKNTADLYRRIRNTLRFLLGALDGFTLQEKISDADHARMPELERLMLHQLAEMDVRVRDNITHYEYGKLAQTLHLFCANELSAFYFDIRKDRLYCDRPDSFERRATRTVMAHIFECLVTWLSPILSFTTEEAWGHRPKGVFEDAESIHLRTFPKIPDDWMNKGLAGKWFALRHVRDLVTAALEPHRANKSIGSSLEASPSLFVNEHYAKALEGIDIAELCLTSEIKIISGGGTEGIFQDSKLPGLSVTFNPAEGQKCLRCWKVLPEVAIHRDHLCHRCADAITVKKAA